MLLVFVIGLLTFFICWDYLHKWKRIRVFEASKLSGPIALPILGSGLEAVSLKAENLLQFIESCHQKYGKTFRMWILNEAQVYTKDVRHFESILSSTTLLQKGDHYDKVRSWLVDGLLLSVGKKWHARRKVFTPAFHFRALEHYVRVFDEQSAIMVQKLQKYADGKTTFDLFPIVCLAALDVITEAAMGVKVNAQSDAEFPYVKALKSVVYTQASRMIKFNQRYDWTFQLTAPLQYRRMWQGIETMHAFTIKVIEERRAALEKSKADGTYKPLNPANEDIGSKEQMALLDILLQSTIDGKPLSNEDIREEVDTFMFEGDDTTTSGVSHALYCIARHPKVQQKLYQEIQEIIGANKDTPIDIAQLSGLKYMECVIKETLRLHPSVPGIGRKTTHDLKLDDIVIPANTSIYLMFYWAHRDPAVFPDPEAFIPERFDSTSEENLKRNPFAYVPFSAGPRNCIGQKFAMLEMKTMISKVLRCYELLPLGPTVEPMMNFILRSPHGVCIGLRPRVTA